MDCCFCSELSLVKICLMKVLMHYKLALSSFALIITYLYAVVYGSFFLHASAVAITRKFSCQSLINCAVILSTHRRIECELKQNYTSEKPAQC